MRRWWLLVGLLGCGDGASPPDAPPSATLSITRDGSRVAAIWFDLPFVLQTNYAMVSVANAGTITSKSLTVTLSGDDAFAIDDRSTCASAMLDVHSSCTLILSFIPVDLDEHKGMLRIASGAEVVKLPVTAQAAVR
jgi:hypothetical protein